MGVQTAHNKNHLRSEVSSQTTIIEERGIPRCRAIESFGMRLPRFHIEGHIYYITTVIYNRLPIFTRSSFVIPLLDSLNYYRYKQ